jgi:hypothetical protein
MSRSVFRHLRLLGPLTAAATLGIGALPAFAQTATPADCTAIRFELANPSPGSRIEPGGLVLQGIAIDSRAQQGPGIDRIDFFLGSRDSGGTNLGMAVPGMVPGPFGPESFQTTISVPNAVGGHDLFAYAHSEVTGQESIIAIPVAVGMDPSKAGEAANPANMMETCTSAMGSTTPITTPEMPSTTTTTPATAPVTTVVVTPEMPPSSTSVMLDVGNPAPGATIHVGGYVIEGMAFDREANEGTGIDRIDIFLDNRDTGGIMLGGAAFGTDNLWHAMVNLPTNMTGLHTLFFFAHSTATGSETVVTIPVVVAP